jgi:hypothetical protein
MKQDMTFPLVRMILLVVVCVGSDPALSGAHVADSSQRTASAPYTLDVLVQGPVGIVQGKNGVDIYVPEVEGHSYVYVKGLNDCDPALGPGDYQIGVSPIDPNQPHTSIDKNIPPELKIQYKPPLDFDPAEIRFAKISLPTPWEIVEVHTDPATIYDKKPMSGGTKKDYPTVMALRYQLTAEPKVAVSGGSNTYCGGLELGFLDPEAKSGELILTIGVGPDVEDDDDHTHAKNAFRSLVALFPPLKKFADFPKRLRSNQLHGSDCRAPMILLTDAP